jgi:hypothetical protein
MILSGGKHKLSMYPYGKENSLMFRSLGRLLGSRSKESTAIQLSQKIIRRLSGGKSVVGSIEKGFIPAFDVKMNGMLISASLIMLNYSSHRVILPFYP